MLNETVTLDAGNTGSTIVSFSFSNDRLSMSFSGGNSFANGEESAAPLRRWGDTPSPLQRAG